MKKPHKWSPSNPLSLRWWGEYSDYVERPPRLRKGLNHQKPKRKKK
jgi:hypothetical protein